MYCYCCCSFCLRWFLWLLPKMSAVVGSLKSFLQPGEQVTAMQLRLPLVATLQVDLVLVLVTVLALWTRLSQLSYPNAVV